GGVLQQERYRERALAHGGLGALARPHRALSAVAPGMLLSGVLVIDATERLGWGAGRVLADLGAGVLKLEASGSDRSRADWRAFNVNKRMLELDLQASADRARLEGLLRAADICLLTPSDSNAHLDPQALRENYPRLVVVPIRPFGGVGSRSAWRASDIELM